MTRIVVAVILIWTSMTTANAAFEPMTGDQIRLALAGRWVKGESFKQWFLESGETEYVYQNGGPSLGRWRVQGDQYCSLWPPSGTWACYNMSWDRSGKATIVRWIDAAGDVSEAVIQD